MPSRKKLSFSIVPEKNLGEVKKFLQQAKEHGVKVNMADLVENVGKSEIRADEYDKLLAETAAKTAALDADLKTMADAGVKYLKACEDYTANQSKKLEEEIQHATSTAATASQPRPTAEKMIERITNIQTGNEIIQTGLSIRMGVWKAVACRDPKLLQETRKEFDTIFATLDAIKKNTTQEVNLKQIEDCRGFAKTYNDRMGEYLTKWLEREDINARCGMAAQAILDGAKGLEPPRVWKMSPRPADKPPVPCPPHRRR